jgi:hypothetical protein
MFLHRGHGIDRFAERGLTGTRTYLFLGSGKTAGYYPAAIPSGTQASHRVEARLEPAEYIHSQSRLKNRQHRNLIQPSREVTVRSMYLPAALMIAGFPVLVFDVL